MITASAGKSWAQPGLTSEQTAPTEIPAIARYRITCASAIADQPVAHALIH